ncbi:MAG: diguanylate cyclase [Acidobacteriota bacterium]|nr:diguanylate cyclase [Acidobacteriota bacterium]
MNVLVADDSGLYRETLRKMLEKWGYQVVLASNGYEAQQILSSDDPPRMAILDVFMPGLGGFDLCHLMRERSQPYVYIILLSIADSPSDVLDGFENGADDYLCKPVSEAELIARLRVGERIIRSQHELLEAHEALRFEASHDSLLRIWNRAAILDLLNTEISRAARQQAPLCLFFVDLDGFKQLNDTYGHLAGDAVLRNAAEKLSAAVREYDHVGRYGGDEFLVVLPDCNVESARMVAERVRQNIGCDPIMLGNHPVAITVSIGIAQWVFGQDLNGLLARADSALYKAKENGRNRIEFETLTSTNN